MHHKFIFKIHQIIGSHEPKRQGHFWPHPPKNYWNNFKLFWICTSMEKVSLFHQFILEDSVNFTVSPITRLAAPIFDHANPNFFQLTFLAYSPVFWAIIFFSKKSGSVTHKFLRISNTMPNFFLFFKKRSSYKEMLG